MNETVSTGTDARQVRTRSNLWEALLTLLETRPFDQVTIREIAKQAGIGYATFFRHYPSKEALLDDVAADAINAMVSRSMPMMDAGDTKQTCVEMFEYIDENRALWTCLLNGGAAPALKHQLIQSSMRLAQEHPRDMGELPIELRLAFSVSASLEVIAWWLRQDKPFSIEKMAEIHDRLIVSPSVMGVEL